MVTMKDLLLHHLEYTFEKEAWQPSLVMAVQGLTAKQAAWAPGPERHSAWQMVRHITLWKRATLDAWDGSKPLVVEGTPTAYAGEVERADWPAVSGDDATWQADLKALHEISQTLQRRAKALGHDSLQAPFPGEEMPTVLRILRMATHDVYHAGQIRYLRALQGS